MSPAPPSGSEKGPAKDPVAAFIRDRRQTLGLSVTELAERLGVTPSFISQIESGAKRPTVENARALARVLEVPTDVLEAWVRIYRPESLEDATVTHRTITRYFSGEQETPEPGLEVPMYLADLGSVPSESELASTLAFRQRTRAARAASVPLIAAGCDPGSGPGLDCPVEDTILFDRSILQGPHGTDLFAFRATADSTSRVRDLIEPGSVIVVERGPQKLIPSRVFAIRYKKNLVISHVAQKGNMLLLLPDERGADVDTIDVKGDRELYSEVVRGRVIAVMRALG